MTLTERQIQAQVVEYARLTGWTVWEMQLGSERGGSVYCTPGIPDLYLTRPGQALWLELKRGAEGRISPHQHARHAELRAAGQPVHVARSTEEAASILNAARLARSAPRTAARS